MILHLITDRRRLTGSDRPWAVQRHCLLAQVRHAAAAGIDIVQVRERDLEGGPLESRASGVSRDGLLAFLRSTGHEPVVVPLHAPDGTEVAS